MELFSDLPRGSTIAGNHLLYGDNLTVMRSMPDQCVDLIYLDPPFNSQRTYNLIYKQATGLPVPEQEVAFCDAWELDAEKDQLARDLPMFLAQHDVPGDVVAFWKAWIQALRGTHPRLLAYLVYMTYRLIEMRRLLKSTGSIWLHCDPTASHYIKIILDGVFDHDNFLSEVIWKRTSAHSSARRCGPVHDVIFHYAKSRDYKWRPVYQDYDQAYVDAFYVHQDQDGRKWRRSDLTGAGTRNGETGQSWRGIDVTAKGRHWAYPPSELDRLDQLGKVHWPAKVGGMPMLKRYLDEQKGAPLQDVWTDIKPIHNMARERLGYPTQKPIALLERIIQTSTDAGDTIFDPFAGCGTSIFAAHLSDRRWVGCDIAILSVNIVRQVLQRRHGLREGIDFKVGGIPSSEEAARDLFRKDPHQFQNWAVEAVGGFCSLRKSGDQGIDGRIWFDTEDGLRSMVLEVKGGKIKPDYIRSLRGVLEREDSAMLAGFICLEEPSRGMIEEAASAGMCKYRGNQFPRIQLLTVAQMFQGREFKTPTIVRTMDRERQSPLPLQGRHKREMSLPL